MGIAATTAKLNNWGEMFRFLFKTKTLVPVPVPVPVAVAHLLRFNTGNGVGTVSNPCLLYLLQLQSLSTTAETTTRTRRRQSVSGSGSKSSPISSAEYLVRSLGIPPESALTITMAEGIELKSTENADSVLALFKDYGFTSSHITTIFSKCPFLLALNAHEYLKPKLDFFIQNGISGDTLFNILTAEPHVLGSSLHRRISPCISFLNSFLGHNRGRVAYQLSVKRGTFLLSHWSESIPANVQTLRDYGIPDSHILKAMSHGYRVGSLATDKDDFGEAVKEVKEMGFDPSSMMFLRAVSTINGMKKEKLEAKFELLKSFGWMDEQVQALFVKLPHFFQASHEKLKIALEFFMNKLNWTVHDVSTYPTALLYSFDKRILPRFCVLEILISEGLEKNTCIGKAILLSEDVFLRKFVKNYQEHIPQLLEVYQKKKMAL